MPVCFSFTAPIITEVEERAEREALTAEERIAIENDLFGTEDVAAETPKMIANGLTMMHAALLEIPTARKAEYLHALDQVPHLVQSESILVAFLRAENYDAWAAAERLVEHWKLRKKVFADKAFLPMTLEGAMAEEVENFEHGAVRLLPDDQKGRAVIFFDRIRCAYLGMNRQSVHRCLFYVICVAAERESAQRRGVIFIVNLKVRNIRHRSSGHAPVPCPLSSHFLLFSPCLFCDAVYSAMICIRYVDKLVSV
jgi:hypothetical protein